MTSSFETTLASLSKPKNPYFSCGPVQKPKGWRVDDLDLSLLGRSHRSAEGIDQIKRLEHSVRNALSVPQEYELGFIVGSATASIEAALWNLIGAAPLTIHDFDTFSNRWALDVINELKPKTPVIHHETPFGLVPNLFDTDPDQDLLLCWNGTTSGCVIPHPAWLNPNRHGLVIVDATSAAYCMALPFHVMDVVAFSFQKGLGGEAGLGCIIISPKAKERLKTYEPSWGIPRLFRLKDGDFGVFEAKLLNTPSWLSIADALLCHTLYESTQALDQCRKNKEIFDQFLKTSPYFEHPLAQDPSYQSPSSGVFRFKDSKYNELIPILKACCAKENMGLDIVNHSSQPPSFRVWLGSTIDEQDLTCFFNGFKYMTEMVLQHSPKQKA